MKLAEKLIYYRKKHKLSQESVASKLDVSRQTITKWENGIGIPQIDFLISLSVLYGVTVDELVKENDCGPQVTLPIEKNELVDFLITAKRNTYANSTGKVESSRVQSHDFQYIEGEYAYYDTYLGSKQFCGEEAVWKQGMSIWSMNYYGRVIGDNFSSSFLKESMLQGDSNAPYRGPTFYQNGEYTYICEWQGSFEFFSGKETIYYKNTVIYELLFHGGVIE